MKIVAVLACMIVQIYCLDIGTGGVYDSPMSTDRYVKQYGYLFGGGRSGFLGLKAIQESQDRFHIYRSPSLPRNFQGIRRPKNTVELSPLKIDSPTKSKPVLFHRFMAVPWNNLMTTFWIIIIILCDIFLTIWPNSFISYYDLQRNIKSYINQNKLKI